VLLTYAADHLSGHPADQKDWSSARKIFAEFAGRMSRLADLSSREKGREKKRSIIFSSTIGETGSQ
jgi:hypothetical protein